MSALKKNPVELFSYLNDLRLEEKFYDVVIKIQDRAFPCHRIILASALTYFRNMFSGNYKEAEKKEIELKGINANDFELLLTHIYGGSVSFDENNICRLLQLSNYLCLQSLKESCIDYLVDCVYTISFDVAVRIFVFASRSGIAILIEKFVKCMAENFASASKYAKFATVSGTALLKILSHPNLNKDIAAILDFLAVWITYQSNEDRKLLTDLLNAVHLGEVPKEWFVKALSHMNNPALINIVQNNESSSMESGLTDNGERVFTEENFLLNMEMDDNNTSSDQNKIQLPFKFYIYVNYSNIEVYKFNNCNNLQLNNSIKHEYCGTSLTGCKNIFIDEVQYLISSSLCNSNYYVCICDNFDLDRKLSVYSISHKTASVIAAACGTGIYIYNNSKFLKFNCEISEWIEILNTNFVKTEYPNLLSYNNSLYLVGGKKIPIIDGNLKNTPTTFTDEVNGKFFQHYDIRGGKWTQLPHLIYSHSQSASCIHNDVLYVSGGSDIMWYKKYIECFDFKANKWYKLETSMPERKMNHILLPYDDKLWFFGGQKYYHNKIVEDFTWYSYDIKEHTWSDVFSVASTFNNKEFSKIFDVSKI